MQTPFALALAIMAGAFLVSGATVITLTWPRAAFQNFSNSSTEGSWMYSGGCTPFLSG